MTPTTRRLTRASVLSAVLALALLLAAAPNSCAKTPVGTLRPRSSGEIRASKWSIGTETQDRNLTVYDAYQQYIAPLGAKRARLQCGWGRCDPNGTGAFNWAWLDQAVFGIAEKGIKPWLELSYGNSAYPGGGANGPGAAVPNSTVALTAWARWVTAVAKRYGNVTDEFELWNEPRLGPDNYRPYATLAAITCRALHLAGTPSKPKLFYGTLSGGYASAGISFLNGTLPILRDLLQAGRPRLRLEDCVAAVTYHAYTGTGTGPESTHAATRTTGCGGHPSPCSGVEALDATLKQWVPTAFVFQGECGAPAVWMRGGAMEPWNWTETKQMKWNLRSMMGDAARPLVRYSSLFTAMDICYDPGSNNVGFYGLVAATCAGAHPYENKTVDHVRPAYRAAQSVMSLWDDDVVPVAANFTFTCDRPQADSRCHNATVPAVGYHCDLAHSSDVAHPSVGSAIECQQACCSAPRCNCWTWSDRTDATHGCWLKNSSAPLLPAANLTAGKVTQPPHLPNSTRPFRPAAYTFRNVSVSGGSISHFVFWDATPTMQEEDKLTTCNVTVTSLASSEPQRPGWHQSAPHPVGQQLLYAFLSNGTVFPLEQMAGTVQTQADKVYLTNLPLYDAPILVVRQDAIPPPLL